MTIPQALAIADAHGMRREFWLSYRQARPWWAFWVREDEAVWLTLVDLDLAEWT